MAIDPSTAIYNAENQTIYVTTDNFHQGWRLNNFYKIWDDIVFKQNLVNFNTIIDMRNLSIDEYWAVKSEEGDISYADCGIEALHTRKRGSGKVLLVVDPAKGASHIAIDTYVPDGLFFTIEDAETFIRNGDGVDRSDLAENWVSDYDE